MSVRCKKLKEITVIRTGKLDSNASVENGIYPFFTCDPLTLRIDTWAYDTEAVLLAGNNASGNYTAKYYKGKFNAYQRTYIIESADKNLLNTRYLCYAINQQLGLLKTMSSGSTTKFLTIRMLHDLDIPFPDITSQIKIAEIIGSYDDLIENNQRQIKLLEEAAQRLYREWFVDLRFPGHESIRIVDGVPEGWQKCTLNDVISFNPKVSLSKTKQKEFIPMSALSTSSMIIDKSEISATSHNSGSKFQNNDTLLARITPCLENGKTGFVFGINPEGAIGSTEFIVMRSLKLNPYMVYLLARTDDFRDTAIKSMTGSDGRQRAQVEKLKSYLYLLPTPFIISKFEEVVKPLFIQIQNLNSQCALLVEARDRLLPKLMSGEMEV